MFTQKSGKLKPFEEDPQTKAQFEKQLEKYIEDVKSLTPYTIYGLCIKSEFSIAVRIQMEPSFLSTSERQEREIPIIIRSTNHGNHIQDIMQLQNLELKVLPKKIMETYPFI